MLQIKAEWKEGDKGDAIRREWIRINYSHYFYIWFLDIIHFIAESLPVFTNLSLSPPFPVLSSHFSTLYVYNFDFFGVKFHI